MKELLERIRTLAGVQRHNTFVMAAEKAAAIGAKRYVETGCYRGMDCDGCSTAIWALLAEFTGGYVVAIDLSEDSINRTKELLEREKVNTSCITLVHGDSLVALPGVEGPIDVLYLDSFDHCDNNPDPCQRHQAAEAAICLPKMAERSIILLDDCQFDDGGKSRLSIPLILQAGYECVAQEYQNLYCRGIE